MAALESTRNLADPSNFGRELAQQVKQFVQRELAAITERIDAMEKQQQRSLADAFKGSHLPGTSYARGDLVQRSGVLWLCLTDSTATPGSSTDWRQLSR